MNERNIVEATAVQRGFNGSGLPGEGNRLFEKPGGDKQSLIRIASKSDFMKSHISRRGKKK